MDTTWHAVLRDISVILAAGSLALASLLAALVVWQLYRLAVEVRGEIEPIVNSLRATAQTVQGTTEFLGQRTVPPLVTAAGIGVGGMKVLTLLTAFYSGLRHERAIHVRLRD